MFITAQVMSGIAILIAVVGLQFKDKNRTIFFMGISNIFIVLSFLFLDAYLGLVLMLIATIRMFVFFFIGKNEKFNPKLSLVILIVFEIALVVSSILTWENLTSLLVMLGFIIYTYGCWQKNRIVYLSTNIFLSICNIIYNIYCKGYTNIVLEAMLIIASVVPLATILVQYINDKDKFKQIKFPIVEKQNEIENTKQSSGTEEK